MSSSTATAEDPFAILGETLETAASALDLPTAHARESAHRAAATTKRVVGSGMYSVSYALAYGAVFAATYVHDLMPHGSAVQRGFSDGAQDALSARSRRLDLRHEAAGATASEAHESHEAPHRDGADHEAKSHEPKEREAKQSVEALADRFEASR